jgi:CHAT domain-containing protein
MATMKVLVLEACRSPEMDKDDTEAKVLSAVLPDLGIAYEQYSNDGCWPDRVDLDPAFVADRLAATDATIIHFAMHGHKDPEQGLILRWSTEPWVGDRNPTVTLPAAAIQGLPGLAGKLVVSGACYSDVLAPTCLAAGATAVVAPNTEVDWEHLGAFFATFYGALTNGKDVADALAAAKAKYPEYASTFELRVP